MIIVKNQIIKLSKYPIETVIYLSKYFKANFFEENELLIFEFKLFKYIYNHQIKEFQSLILELNVKIKDIKAEMNEGLNHNENSYLKEVIGQCLIEIKIKNVLKLILIEFSDPFYLFQVFSIILWMFYENYYHYAVIIIISTAISIAIGVYETKTNLEGIKSIAEYTTTIRRLNKETRIFNEINSKFLAPGDIIEVPNDHINLPCDCILLSGTVVVNESVLTGESVPVVKSDINESSSEIHFDLKKDLSLNKHVLYTGTKVIQKRANLSFNTNSTNYNTDIYDIDNNKGICIALVFKTGFNSEKGNLIRAILNPKDQDNEFKKESFKYISGMFIAVCVIYSIVFSNLKNDTSVEELLVLFFDMITIGVPPALPACLGIGIGYAVARLKKGKIICIKREKVNIAGQVTHIVFDKTGTLTEDHLEEYGFILNKLVCIRSMEERLKNNDDKENQTTISFVFDKFINSHKEDYKSIFTLNNRNNNNCSVSNLKHIENFNKNFEFKNPHLEFSYLKEECYACCNSLTLINDKIVGDPIEEEMFNGINWSMHSLEGEFSEYKNVFSPSEYCSQLRTAVVKTFSFISKLQRMSVIVKSLTDDRNDTKSLYKIYTKGSPEKIKLLCNSHSIPANYDHVLKKYTSNGLRVLSLAFKLVSLTKEEDISGYTRDEVESNLVFLGFYIVQNKLKKETKQEIEILKNAALNTYMATGDNILTASFIAHECNMIKDNITALELLQDGEIHSTYFEAYSNNKNNSIGNIELKEIDSSYVSSVNSTTSNEDKKNSISNGNLNTSIDIYDENLLLAKHRYHNKNNLGKESPVTQAKGNKPPVLNLNKNVTGDPHKSQTLLNTIYNDNQSQEDKDQTNEIEMESIGNIQEARSTNSKDKEEHCKDYLIDNIDSNIIDFELLEDEELRKCVAIVNNIIGINSKINKLIENKFNSKEIKEIEEESKDNSDTNNENAEYRDITDSKNGINNIININNTNNSTTAKTVINTEKNNESNTCLNFSSHYVKRVLDFIGGLNLTSNNNTYAIDGNLFDLLIRIRAHEKTDTYVKDLINILLNNKCKIYARMTPEMKAQLVNELQKNEEIVMMCGDGANDCAALRAANVGVSLSLEEASIAAPFTSKINNISTIKKILREGKASLVTSFQCFKFMIMYSIIVLIAGSMLMASKTYLSDDQFLIVDMFLIIPFAILIARTGAYNPLNQAIPTTSLFSVQVLTSLVLQNLLCIIVLFVSEIILKNQEWYIPDPHLQEGEIVSPGYLNTVSVINKNNIWLYFLLIQDIIFNLVYTNNNNRLCFDCFKAF